MGGRDASGGEQHLGFIVTACTRRATELLEVLTESRKLRVTAAGPTRDTSTVTA
jgi:hypothetical protein